MAICIAVACNHPDNGHFAGVAPLIEIGEGDGEDYLELECWSRKDRAPNFTETSRGFRLLRREWPVVESKYGIGNWCWNAYWLRYQDAVAFVCWLRLTGFYGIDAGESGLFEWWKYGGDFPGFAVRSREHCLQRGLCA